MPHLPEIPLSDPVLIFALAMVVFLVVPMLLERARVPGLIGLILAGALIGENGIGLLERNNTIVLFGTVGLLYLMFLVGLELDIEGVRRDKRPTLVFGILSFAVPAGLGVALGLALGHPLRSAALIGAMLSSHTSVAYPIASRLGIVRTKGVTTALGATLIVDLLALLVLAIVSKADGGALDASFWVGLLAPLLIYLGLVLVVLPRITKWFFRAFTAEGPTEYLFTLAALFSFSYLAHLAGIEPVIGALLVGFALNRLIPEHSPLMNRLKFTAESIFVPFFLLSVGMLIDLRGLLDPSAWLAIGGFLIVALASKGVAAFVTAKLFKYPADDGKVMFGLSVSRAAATIAIALVGYRLGVIDEAVVNAVAVMILVTCVVGPWAVARYGRAVALREERRPFTPSATLDRVLIPIANPKSRDALLDLSFILRGSSTEPLFPLVVVGEEDDTDAAVAEAERALQHAVLYAAGADVPVHPLTRVDPNVASGIARGMAETRANVVVIGWDGEPTTSRAKLQRMFGSVLDQLLESTLQFVVVAKLGHPVATTDRIVLVAPPAASHHPGFSEAARMVKALAQKLGADLLALAIEDDPESLRATLAQIKPDVKLRAEAVARFSDLQRALELRLAPRDLVVVISARRGMVSWHPKLERLPRLLAHLVPESFLMLYPGVRERPSIDLSSSGEAWPAGLTPSKVVSGLGDPPWEEAIRAILAPGFENDADGLDDVVRSIVDGFAAELRPGVVVPHARRPGLAQPQLFLGVSELGVRLPDRESRAHLLFVLLSPAEDPEAHLRALAELSRLVRSAPRLHDLVQRGGADAASVLAKLGGHASEPPPSLSAR